MTTLIFIIYDGINNSVFEGQVLEPLRKRKQYDPSQQYVLITFERHPDSVSESNALTSARTICAEVHILKRFPYLGIASLYHSAHMLRTILKQYPSYEIIPRGPLAGWIALHAADKHHCAHITIQARGLCAEEYAYTHAQSSLLTRWWHAWRSSSLHTIEQKVYGTNTSSCTIETVSPALSTYLIDTFKAKPDVLVHAPFDVPPLISPEQKNIWRTQIRTGLGISDTAVVYCYNGSMKSWQCPELVLNYVEHEYKKNSEIFFLVLTQDAQVFTRYLHTRNMPASTYKILHVQHHEIYAYLCAADKGIIFRQPSIINWVSRPTKVLEYRAAQLAIVHNNTIGYLHQQDQKDFSGDSYYECS